MSSSNINLTGSNFTNNIYGIGLGLSNNNSLLANTINNNVNSGIYLDSSDSTRIKGNILNRNADNIFESNCKYNKISWNVYNDSITPFIIDDIGNGNFTWTQAASELAWCIGSGTPSNPYNLEDLIICNYRNQTGKSGIKIYYNNGVSYIEEQSFRPQVEGYECSNISRTFDFDNDGDMDSNYRLLV